MGNMSYYYMLIFGSLLLLSQLLEYLAEKFKLPAMLLILVMGLMIPDFLGNQQPLITIHQAESIANLGLVVILFYGGLTTRWSAMRHVLWPGLRMATLGCLITAGSATGLIYGLWALQGGRSLVPVLTDSAGTTFPADLPLALFLGAMLCSTDATAVLALLRPIASKIPKKLLNLIECESGFNDPMAVVLAGVALALAQDSLGEPLLLIRDVVLEFGLGGLIGAVGAVLGVFILSREHISKPSSGSEIICLSLLMLSAATSYLLGGSPLLCAYVMGCIVSNSDRVDCVVVSDFAIFNRASELIVLICLGLVVFPADVWPVKWYALVVFLITMASRLVMTYLTLHGSPFGSAEKGFAVFAGLRGAVPIAIALESASSGVAWGSLMPAFALAVVMVGLVAQGYFLPAATDLLAQAIGSRADDRTDQKPVEQPSS